MDKRGVVSGFSGDKFLSHSAKKLRRGTSLCSTEFPVSKKLMEKTGRDHDFPSNIFCLTVPKKSLREAFFVSQIFFHRKMSGIREGVIHVFPSKIFLSHSAEEIQRGTLL